MAYVAGMMGGMMGGSGLGVGTTAEGLRNDRETAIAALGRSAGAGCLS